VRKAGKHDGFQKQLENTGQRSNQLNYVPSDTDSTSSHIPSCISLSEILTE